MAWTILPGVVTAALLMAGGAAAAPYCVANGTLYEQGAVVCLRPSGKPWLALCGKVLNNTSWERLEDGCRPDVADSPPAPGFPPPRPAPPSASDAG